MPRKYTRRIRRRRVKRGGDIESGTPEEIPQMDKLPPDPDRFKMYQDNLIKELQKVVSDEEAAAVYAGPNPKEKMEIEQKMMGDEDPLNQDPFYSRQLNIFSRGGRRTRKIRRNKRKASRHRRR
jgi:hypothetical protein